MGYDIYGLNSKNEQGNYFRSGVHGWGSIWDTVCELSGSTLSNNVKKRGLLNDGVEINENKAMKIVEKIDYYLYNDFKGAFEDCKTQKEQEEYLIRLKEHTDKKLKKFFDKFNPNSYSLVIATKKLAKSQGATFNESMKTLDDFVNRLVYFKNFMRNSGGFIIQ